MLSRHAVLLTRNPTKDSHSESAGGGGMKDLAMNPPIDARLPPATPQESTLVEVFIPSSLNLFGINADWGRPHSAQFLCNVSPFRINTSESVSKQKTLSTFRINTYEKQAGGGRASICSFTSFVSPYFVTSLLPYVQKRRRPSRSDGGSCEKGVPSSGEKIVSTVLRSPRTTSSNQLSGGGGGGGASGPPLNS